MKTLSDWIAEKTIDPLANMLQGPFLSSLNTSFLTGKGAFETHLDRGKYNAFQLHAEVNKFLNDTPPLNQIVEELPKDLAVPEDVELKTLDHYIQRTPELNAELKRINALARFAQESAAHGEYNYFVVRDDLHKEMGEGRIFLQDHYDRAEAAIKRDFPEGNEKRATMLQALNERKEADLKAFNEQLQTQIGNTHKIAATLETAYHERLVNAMKAEQDIKALERLKEAQQPQTPMPEDAHIGITSTGAIILDGIDLGDLGTLRTATGNTITTNKKEDGSFYYEISPSKKRWWSRHDNQYDDILFAMHLIRTKHSNVTWDVGPQRHIKDPKKRAKEELKLARKAYEAAREAGFADHEIVIKLPQPNDNIYKINPDKTNKKEKSLVELYADGGPKSIPAQTKFLTAGNVADKKRQNRMNKMLGLSDESINRIEGKDEADIDAKKQKAQEKFTTAKSKYQEAKQDYLSNIAAATQDSDPAPGV